MSRPVLVRLGGPGEDRSTVTVALSDQLRRRGYRVGSASLRPAVLGTPEATVLVLGSGARVTLPHPAGIAALPALAASLDPQLDVLLVEGYGEGPDALHLEGAHIEAVARPDDLAIIALADEVARTLGAGSDIEARSTAEAAIETSRSLVRPLPAEAPPPTQDGARPLASKLRGLAARFTRRDR